MSFLLALADRDVALVASETRFCSDCPAIGERRPAAILSDGGPFSLRSPLDGAVVRIPAAPYRNVRRLGGRWHAGGWVTGTLMSPGLQLVYDALASCELTYDAMATAVRTTTARYAAALRDPQDVERLAGGAFFVILPSPLGFTAACLRPSGEITNRGMNVPPELSLPDNGTLPTFERDVLRPLLESWTGGCRDLGERLRAVGAAFQRVAELVGPTGTANDRVELGLLRRVVTGERWSLRYDYLEPTAAVLLRDLPNPETLLEPVEVRCD